MGQSFEAKFVHNYESVSEYGVIIQPLRSGPKADRGRLRDMERMAHGLSKVNRRNELKLIGHNQGAKFARNSCALYIMSSLSE
jgi:hypothetical protein